MADYIDRQALDVVAFTDRDGTFSDGIQWLLEYIDTLPSADVEPVRHGVWMEENGFIYCPFCGDPWGAPGCESMVKSFNYCPNCGARMEGD